MNLPEFSVRHSIFGNMLTLFVIVGGIIMLTLLQRDTFPDIELDLVVITTRYANASPEEIENLITNPIEEEIGEVEDIEEFFSSSVESMSVITVQIDPEARFKERVINEVQRKVDQVTGLPSEAEDPEVLVISAKGPIIRVCVTGAMSEQELRRYGDYLESRLKQIGGVSSVTKVGWRDEEFWVEVDLPELIRQELSLSELNRSLVRQNVNRPGGKLPDGTREVVLRTLGQFHTAEEIGEVVIRSNTDGNHVLLRDIASIRRTFEEDDVKVNVNGTRALILEVKKKQSGDTISIADQVKELIQQEQDRAPAGVALTYVDDESYYVKRRLNVLKSNGIIGMLMVVVVLFLFLNFRVAIITGIGIPFALLAALMIMSLFGITINLITMFGLIIVLGMLVDDAIIVGENIFRHLEEGASPRRAAIDGTTEVMYPVVSTVLTTVAAFVPLLFMPDIMGQVLRWFPVVVSITLFASLFEVLLVMPCHVVDFVPAIRKPGARANGSANGHPVMRVINGIYRTQLGWALKLRYLFLLLVVLVFAGLLHFSIRTVRIDIFPADLIDMVLVQLSAPQGTSLDHTETVIKEVEHRIEDLPEDELEHIVTYVGANIDPSGGFKSRGTRYASAIIYLSPQNTRARKTQTIIDELREVCRDIPDIDKIEFEMIEPGPPTGKPLEVKVRGADYNVLKEISAEIMEYLEAYGGVQDIQRDYEPGKDELHITMEQKEAARLGLDMEIIAQTVFTAFQGAEATIVREGNEEIKVRVKLKEPYRSRRDTLEKLTVPNRTGRLIELCRVADIEEDRGLPAVFHYDGDRVITVSASFSEGVSSTRVNRDLEKAFRDLPSRYPGYDLIRGGEWKETRKLMLFMFKALGLALLLIYVILSVQFDSVLQPFVVMAAIPLGMIGVVIALILHDKPISIMAMMGMMGMTGVVVNDAIVLVKFINDQRRRGEPVYDALIAAGLKRMRPILLTSATTIVGLMPVIYGWGGYEPFVAPAAITLAYGLLFATFLTLMVVPCTYHVGYDIKRIVLKVVGFFSPRRSPDHP